MGKTREEILTLHPITQYDPLKQFPPTEWLIENLWLSGGKINGMFGPEKSGKSRLLCWLLACMLAPAEIDPIPGTHLVKQPTSILYMRGEETEKDVTERLALYADMLGVSSVGWPITFMAAANYRLDWRAYSSTLYEVMQFVGADLVIMEPLRRLHGGKEDSSDDMSRIFNLWRTWTDDMGVDILFTHHSPKFHAESDMDRIATWSRGSSDLASVVDGGTFVGRSGKDRITIKRSGRFAPLDDLKLVDMTDESYPPFILDLRNDFDEWDND